MTRRLVFTGVCAMAKSPKKPKDEDVEVVPGAWERFERVIDTITSPSRSPAQNWVLREGDYFLVVGDKLRIAHPTSAPEGGSITVDLYRNLEDYRRNQVMEHNFIYCC